MPLQLYIGTLILGGICFLGAMMVVNAGVDGVGEALRFALTGGDAQHKHAVESWTRAARRRAGAGQLIGQSSTGGLLLLMLLLGSTQLLG